MKSTNLYTKLCAAVTLLALCAGALDAAQRSRRRRAEARGPRALAVLEFPADEKLPPRLVPVSLLDSGRMLDAGIYRASPVPMALESGVVYEAEKSGVPQGFFTVESPSMTQDRWVARGRWEPHSEKKPEPETAAAPAASAQDLEAPPILRRPRGEPQPPPVPGPAAPEASVPARPSQPEDPDRPVLRRNPGGQRPQSEKIAEEPIAFEIARTLVALSDAGAEPSRPYDFKWTADEERRTRAALLEAAAQVLRPRVPNLSKGRAPALTDVQLFPFDLEYDNYGDIVMSATWQPPAQGSDAARTYFITLVARLDIDGKPRVVLSRVTDARRLDSQPRLELVDAVDADGDGTAELLFRAVGDRNYTYVLYRIFPQDARQLFETAPFPFPR